MCSGKNFVCNFGMSSLLGRARRSAEREDRGPRTPHLHNRAAVPLVHGSPMPVGWGACMCACELLKSPVARSIIPGKPCSSCGRGGTCEVTEIHFATATYGGIRATSY